MYTIVHVIHLHVFVVIQSKQNNNNCTSKNKTEEHEIGNQERAVILKAFAQSEADEQEKWWRRMSSTDSPEESDEGKCGKLKSFFEDRIGVENELGTHKEEPIKRQISVKKYVS